MRARHWMIACLIGVAGTGSAMASDFTARDLPATSRAAADSGARDAGGNPLELSRDGSVSSHHGNDADNGDADGRNGGVGDSGERGGGSPAPGASKPAMLGWQSLLPGSIQ